MGIRSTILFGLTLIDEVMREFRDPGGFLSFSYENLYGFVPSSYKRRNLYGVVNSLKANNYDLPRLYYKADRDCTVKYRPPNRILSEFGFVLKFDYMFGSYMAPKAEVLDELWLFQVYISRTNIRSLTTP